MVQQNPYCDAKRSGFTLVELLVVITVMVTLGGMLTYALASAETDARVKRTEADVVTIGQVLQRHVNDVALSKMNLVYGAPSSVTANATGPGSPATANYPLSRAAAVPFILFESAEKARLILAARRDMLRMVLPECQADLLYPPASLQFRTRAEPPIGSSGASVQYHPNVAQLRAPNQWNQMRTLLGLLSADTIDTRWRTSNPGFNPASDPKVDAIQLAGNATFEALLRQKTDGTAMTWTREHESAECLYLILATTELFNGKAIDQIPSSRIVDTDGDQVPEIVDAWGQPYVFIRQPISLETPVIKNFNSTAAATEQYRIDPDPLGLLNSDFRYLASVRDATLSVPDSAYQPIYLPPVVISSGIDKEFGIRTSFVDTDRDGTPEEGVSRSYSSSVVQLPQPIGPTYSYTDPRTNVSYSVPVWRYPDPYFNVSSVPANTTGAHVLQAGGIVKAKGFVNSSSVVEYQGLGATLDKETAADNITSLDAGF
ncbi:type II secretion system protein [Rhodopirellula sp. MGV]|uniref:type II secretion system protein n=1 Tax=Rhodopirellula sp. MGV TaxID=2023130 RepID=UPI000B95FABF|nr:prepilin-type N-terminal cleavage/methylation domain-containing protein [Rhodopirellula sp. MGV]OYP32175.1 hypothetical protein CGZ80_20480 [Rhodopirellula sp. MGV]PNY35183.1 type II secretion system protein [Rhodopirellula baltica]